MILPASGLVRQQLARAWSNAGDKLHQQGRGHRVGYGVMPCLMSRRNECHVAGLKTRTGPAGSWLSRTSCSVPCRLCLAATWTQLLLEKLCDDLCQLGCMLITLS